jgi:hypothetical protein
MALAAPQWEGAAPTGSALYLPLPPPLVPAAAPTLLPPLAPPVPLPPSRLDVLPLVPEALPAPVDSPERPQPAINTADTSTTMVIVFIAAPLAVKFNWNEK